MKECCGRHMGWNFQKMHHFPGLFNIPGFSSWWWLWQKNRVFPKDSFAFWKRGFPFVDYEETNDEYLLKIEVPGIEKDKINCKASKDTLTVEIDGDPHFYPLPPNVVPDKIRAALKSGILTIHIPKSESDYKVNIDKE